MLEQVAKARSQLEQAVELVEGDNGDFWALLYKLESQHGNAGTQAKVPLLVSQTCTVALGCRACLADWQAAQRFP